MGLQITIFKLRGWSGLTNTMLKLRDWKERTIIIMLRGEKLNYKSVAKEISKPPFFGSCSPVGTEGLPCLFDSHFVRFTFSLNVSNHAHIWYVT